MHRPAVLVLFTSMLLAGCSVVGTRPSAGGSSGPEASFASPVASGSATPLPPDETVSPGAWSPPPVPSIPGDHVYSVSGAISARDAGTLGSQTIDVGGYWSDNPLMMSCPAPMHDPNPLQLYCSAGFGITERYEMAWTITSNGVETNARRTTGPLLEPYVPSDLRSRLSPNVPIGPVPVVVAGHFNDPDNANCAPDVRDQCRKTFVIESILVYDPASAPTPPPSPSPTPFPSPPPSGLFDAKQCAGDVPYSFVGWTTADTLNIPMDFTGHAWAVVTKDVVSLGEWGVDPNLPGQHFNLPMGRRVCLGFDLDAGGGGIAFSVVNGTAYRLWDDGRRTSSDEMGPGSGDPSLPAAGSPPPRPNGVEVAMRGGSLADLAATIHDWSGELVQARPATADELALPGSETGNGTNAAALVLPNDARSVLVVMAECGSDRSVSVTITADRKALLLLAADRTDCGNPGARRGAVLTFGSDVPAEITAYAGL
jgi:hypothetical protein